MQGCCSYGAHYSDKADRRRTEQLARAIPDDLWQFAKVGRKKGVSVLLVTLLAGHGVARVPVALTDAALLLVAEAKARDVDLRDRDRDDVFALLAE